MALTAIANRNYAAVADNRWVGGNLALTPNPSPMKGEGSRHTLRKYGRGLGLRGSSGNDQ
ncbi:MAG: hypothetical protein SNJ60_05445 [Pseudanabaenaceae cyanobacterium]